MAGAAEEVVGEPAQPRDERIALPGGLRLRVLRWEPPRTPDAAPAADPASDGAASDPAPFLLVHGLSSNARLWDGVARRLVAAGHPAVAVDLRGHGLSDKPETGYDFATIAEDLRALIGKLGLEAPVLVGQSWGADVVLDLAVRHSELTRGIVLLDGGLNDLADGFESWEACWERLAPPQLVGQPLTVVEGYFRTNHSDWPEEGFVGSLGNFEIRPDGTIAPWLTRERHKLILQAMWGERVSALWPRLRVPALILAVDSGDERWTAGKRAGADRAEAAVSAGGAGVGVRTLWFSGDHDLHAQRPAEVTEALLGAIRDGLFEGVRA
jgi:pimeloyl-ACP methyl ester carboxylesterase